MPRRYDLGLAPAVNVTQFTGGGTNYVVQTPAGVLYCIFAFSSTSVNFKKSTDGGVSWFNETHIWTGSNLTQISVWYDRWSDIAAGLIHVAWTEGTNDDTLYRTINTESSDALSTQTTIFAGGSTAAGGHLSITRARGGNVYCKTCIDAGAEGGFYRLPNANVPNGAWDAARTVNETLATQDQMILLPGFAADNQDIIGIFWDGSANGLSRQLYDDSANTWAESAIITDGNAVDQIAATAFPHFAAAVDIANSRILLVAWSAIDTANADLRCWTITESAITETSTNVVLNSTDDQGLCGIGIDLNTGYWFVVYGGKSDGSETFLTSINLYCKWSTDQGATWSAETQLTNAARQTKWLATVPRIYSGPPVVVFHDEIVNDMYRVNVDVTQPRARAYYQ